MGWVSPVAGYPVQAKFTVVSPELYAYLVAHNPAPDAVLRDLAEETAALGSVGSWQVAVEQGDDAEDANHWTRCLPGRSRELGCKSARTSIGGLRVP